MSYVRMDHAEWVQSQIPASKKMLKGKAALAAIGWAAAPDRLSDFQAKVFDIVGIVFSGVYNAPLAWKSIQWRCGGGIGVPVMHGSLSTFDFSELTLLVFLCHEARIRCSLSSPVRGGLMLYFCPRVRTGGTSTRHPNLAEAVASFRSYLPGDHRIIYRDILPNGEAAG